MNLIGASQLEDASFLRLYRSVIKSYLYNTVLLVKCVCVCVWGVFVGIDHLTLKNNVFITPRKVEGCLIIGTDHLTIKGMWWCFHWKQTSDYICYETCTILQGSISGQFIFFYLYPHPPSPHTQTKS